MSDHDVVIASVREQLNDLIAAHSAEANPLGYGFQIHRRGRPGSWVFGVISLGGESLPLSREMVEALRGQVSWVFGAVPVHIGCPDSDPAWEESSGPQALDAPRILWMDGVDGDPFDGEALARWGLNLPLVAGGLEQPALVLVRARPRGWPL